MGGGVIHRAVDVVAERVPVRAVIDTSALFPPRLRKDLQEAAQLGAFTAIWSPWIVAELNRVLTWQWLRRHGDTPVSEGACSLAAKLMMEWLIPSFTTVDPKPPYPPIGDRLTDQWDHPVWAAAKAGNAHYVVSQNTRHFPPADAEGRHIYEGITYLTGHAFLRLLTRTITSD